MPPKKRPAAAAVSAAEYEAVPTSYSEDGQKSSKQQKTGKIKKENPLKKEKEKRCNSLGATVRYRSNPSQKDADRIDRALSRGMGFSHRLFLIDREVQEPVGSEGGGSEKFVVLGATGNVYDVTINKFPSCSCPDAAKGNLCKHRFFVMLRVLKLEQDDPIVWQTVLLQEEVEKALSSNKLCEASALASSAVQKAYKRATGATPENVRGAAAADAAPLPDEECPICYEDFKSAPEATEQCETCRKHVHKACMQTWLNSTKERGTELLCVLCRSLWKDKDTVDPLRLTPNVSRSRVPVSVRQQVK